MGIVKAASAVYGTCEPAVQRFVATKIDDILDELILEAVELWRASGFVRFDNREVNCAVQVFSHIVRASRQRPKFRILQPRLEHPLLTNEIRSGQQSADTARRPDMHVSIGHRANRSVECKLLSDSGPLARKYVREGMHRFVSGAYGKDDTSGRMIGFVIKGHAGDCVERLNNQVDDFLDESHRLSPHVETLGTAAYRSSHDRAPLGRLDLTHFHIVVPVTDLGE